MLPFVKLLVVFISVYVVKRIFTLYQQEDSSFMKLNNKVQLLVTGFLANIADTLGIGSFAVIVACDRTWNFVSDKKLPGTMNGHSVLPAMIQSLLFLEFVQMDTITFSILVLGASIGGFVGGFTVARLDKQSIRLAMTLGFLGMSFLVLAHQFGLLPFGGEAISLSPPLLSAGFLAMLIAGMLPSIGVGLYAPIQVILFLLGLSPLIAFPIMTTAGAFVQSSTALAFVDKKEIAVKETVLLALGGIIGVIITVPFVTYANPSTLRWLLLSIVLYNTITTGRTYLKERSLLVKV